jgi:hypothetical protein
MDGLARDSVKSLKPEFISALLSALDADLEDPRAPGVILAA